MYGVQGHGFKVAFIYLQVFWEGEGERNIFHIVLSLSDFLSHLSDKITGLLPVSLDDKHNDTALIVTSKVFLHFHLYTLVKHTVTCTCDSDGTDR